MSNAHLGHHVSVGWEGRAAATASQQGCFAAGRGSKVSPEQPPPSQQPAHFCSPSLCLTLCAPLSHPPTPCPCCRSGFPALRTLTARWTRLCAAAGCARSTRTAPRPTAPPPRAYRRTSTTERCVRLGWLVVNCWRDCTDEGRLSGVPMAEGRPLYDSAACRVGGRAPPRRPASLLPTAAWPPASPLPACRSACATFITWPSTRSWSGGAPARAAPRWQTFCGSWATESELHPSFWGVFAARRPPRASATPVAALRGPTTPAHGALCPPLPQCLPTPLPPPPRPGTPATSPSTSPLPTSAPCWSTSGRCPGPTTSGSSRWVRPTVGTKKVWVMYALN